MASGTDTVISHLVSGHRRMGGAVFCQPVRHKQVGLLQLDEDPLHRSRGEDARHNLRCVTARGATSSDKRPNLACQDAGFLKPDPDLC